MTERRLEVVYCDDIRNEIGNKHSLMGVYFGELFVDTMPVVLPKLCAWVNVITPAGNPFQRLRIRVLQDDITLIDTEELVEESAVLSVNGGVTAPDEGTPRSMAANLAIVLCPFQIDAESTLRVVAQTEDGDLESRRLRIRRQTA